MRNTKFLCRSVCPPVGTYFDNWIYLVSTSLVCVDQLSDMRARDQKDLRLESFERNFGNINSTKHVLSSTGHVLNVQ